jgi:hypothetical protein
VTTPLKRRNSPLLYPAAFLSLASLAWTTWSLVDLLGTGWIGFTVAAGSDIVWGSVIIAEARGLRIAGRSWVVAALGWTTLLIVAVFLASHGIARESIAMAAAGPFLPLGAKVVWALALADMRDPAALTHDELHQLARMERGMVFEEREHDIRMRQQRMRAELLMSEVSTDFDIEVMRQDRARDLRRRAPLAITPGHASSAPEPSAEVIGEQPEQPPNAPTMLANNPSGQLANNPLNRPNPVPEQPTIADLVREQIASTTNNAEAIRGVMTARPDANKDSVAAAVRRERRKTQPKDGYA